MPRRGGWLALVGAAAGAAAGTAAAQLGVAYGLGVIDWVAGAGLGAAGVTGRAWLVGLAWTVWIGASSTVTGAVIADRLARHRPLVRAYRWMRTGRLAAIPVAGPVAVPLRRLVTAAAAAVGGCATVPLVAIPSRAAGSTTVPLAGVTASGYALAGVITGLVVSIGVLASTAAAINMVVTTAWVWALAIASVISANAGQGSAGYAPLDVWRFAAGGWSLHSALYSWDILLMLGAALLGGAAAAALPARRGAHHVGTVLSGGTGPLLVAVAYFLAAPVVGIDNATVMPLIYPAPPRPAPPVELSAYLIAPYAVLIGLAGSALATAAAIRWFRSAPATPDTASDLDDYPPVGSPRPGQPTGQA